MRDILLLRWTHWLIMALSVTLTLSAWLITKNQIETRQTTYFSQEVARIQNLLKLRLEKYEDLLWAGVATIQSQSHGVDYDEWRVFTDPLHLTEKYKGINGIGVIYYVPEGELDQFVTTQRIDRPDFRVHPPHEEREFFPITFIEPVEKNQPAVGLDMAHEKNRYTAIKIARRTGQATLTAPIELVQDVNKDVAFLFFAPFYNNNYKREAWPEQDRVNNFIGAVYAPFVFKQLISGLFDHRGLHTLMQIRDGDTILYDETEGKTLDQHEQFYKSVTIPFYGRNWTVQVWATNNFYISFSNNQPTIILLTGIVINILLLGLFVLLSRTNEASQQHAKLSEQHLAQRESELKLIFDNVPVRLFYKDGYNNIIRINNAAAVSLNGRPSDFEGVNTADIYPDVADQYYKDDLEVIKSGLPKLGIIEKYTPVNAPHGWVKTDKVPFIDPQTGETMILAVAQDITEAIKADKEREALIEKLAQSNEELERFAYIASHDLQEPLRMVRSYTQLLQKKYSAHLDADANQYMDIASQAAIRMQTLIEDLLEYARMGDNSGARNDIQVNDVIDYVLKDFDSIITDKMATVTVDSMPMIHGNEIRVSRLFQNLIGNALKYSKKDTPPVIHIGATETETEWLFVISDNGIGIKAEFLTQIFQPFKRLHGIGEYQGTGIGLAICAKIIHGFGGKIWAESEPEIGTSFFFTIQKPLV